MASALPASASSSSSGISGVFGPSFRRCGNVSCVADDGLGVARLAASAYRRFALVIVGWQQNAPLGSHWPTEKDSAWPRPPACSSKSTARSFLVWGLMRANCRYRSPAYWSLQAKVAPTCTWIQSQGNGFDMVIDGQLREFLGGFGCRMSFCSPAGSRSARPGLIPKNPGQ